MSFEIRNPLQRDETFMRLALAEAEMAAQRAEVPVGAVITCGEEIIGRGFNRREELQSPLAHAELLAIEEASRKMGSWRLPECDLYVTLEPCVMCVGAILQARMRRVVFGCLDPKGGAVQSLFTLCDDSRLNHRLPVTSGVLDQECAGLLERFFRDLRHAGKQRSNAERWPSPAEGA